MRRLWLLAAALLLSASPAAASDCWNNVAANQTDCGVVNMFLNGSSQAVPVTPTAPLPVTSNGLPSGASAITAAGTGTTAATTATLAAAAGKTTFICGWSIDADATAAGVGNMTVTGTISGTLTRRQGWANVTNGTAATWSTYSPCIPASAVNTAIVVTSAAAGTGGNTTVTAWGYQQ